MSNGADIRRGLGAAGTVVIKVGSAVLTDPEQGLAADLLESLGEEIVKLLENGRKVLLVSSGAVVEGVSRLRLKARCRCATSAEDDQNAKNEQSEQNAPSQIDVHLNLLLIEFGPYCPCS